MTEIKNIRFGTIWEFLRITYENEPTYINKLKPKMGKNALTIIFIRDVCLHIRLLEITKTTGRTHFFQLTEKGKTFLRLLDDFFIEPET